MVYGIIMKNLYKKNDLCYYIEDIWIIGLNDLHLVIFLVNVTLAIVMMVDLALIYHEGLYL